MSETEIQVKPEKYIYVKVCTLKTDKTLESVERKKLRRKKKLL